MDFFELLRYSIGSQQKVVGTPSEEEWEFIHEIAKKQALTGLLYIGIKKLPKEMRPLKKLLLKWFAKSERIKKRNEEFNAVAVEVRELFELAGIENCILKGQGNTLMYEDPFSRIPGDIDIWINPAKSVIKGGKLVVGEQLLPVEKVSYRHIEIGKIKGVKVEVHLRPSFMNNLIHNARLQKWFDKQACEQFCHSVDLPEGAGMINIPTIEFNVIYQLCHITNHFFYEGIGLRQFVDYYYVLQEARNKIDVFDIRKQLRKFGLYQMAGAVMYVERELLGLPEDRLIVTVDVKRGEFLLDEIMLSGNFGQYDLRVGKFGRRTAVGRNLERLRRDIRLMWLFPSECLWEPVFRLYHYCWRKINS
jgi:hypothetical protein